MRGAVDAGRVVLGPKGGGPCAGISIGKFSGARVMAGFLLRAVQLCAVYVLHIRVCVFVCAAHKKLNVNVLKRNTHRTLAADYLLGQRMCMYSEKHPSES